MPNRSFSIKGRIFDFVREKISLPNGVKKFYDFIKHRGAVVIIPLIQQNKVIILKQYRIAHKKYIFELPAGTLSLGETPLSCAKRELLEETGYKAKTMKKIGKIIPAPGYSSEVLHIYKANVFKSEQIAEKDEDEVIQPFIFTKNKIKKMIKSGKILDAKTIAAFALIGWV